MATDVVVYDKVDKESEKIQDALYALYPQATITDAAIASFADGADGMPVKKLVVAVEPQQDLHGYNAPYPPGGGKQLFDKDNPTVLDNAYFNNLTLANGGGNKGIVIPCNPSTTYTVSLQVKNPVDIAVGSFASMPAIGSAATVKATTPSAVTDKVATLTTGASDAYLFVKYNNTNQTQTYTNQQVLDGLMIEAGSQATAYATYSNICPISGWTGAEIEGCGKNLVPTANGEENTILNTSGMTGPLNGWWSSDFIPVKDNTIYTVKPDTGGDYIVCTYDAAKALMGRYYRNFSSLPSFTFTIGTGIFEGCRYIRLSVGKYRTSNDPGIQLELGSSATDYEEPKGKEISVTFPSSAGTVYGATLTVNPDRTGALVVDWFQVNLDSINWFKTINYPEYRAQFSATHLPTPVNVPLNQTAPIICSCYKTIAMNQSYQGVNQGISMSAVYISVGDPSVDSLDDFLAVINGQTAAYQLATPITYTLTESEISGILTTLYGTNNIWADCGSIQKLTYRTDLGKYIDSHITTAVANALNA